MLEIHKYPKIITKISYYCHSSLYFGDEENNASTDTEDQEQKTGHDVRLLEITLLDPIHKVDLQWYFHNQVRVFFILNFVLNLRMLYRFGFFILKKQQKNIPGSKLRKICQLDAVVLMK